jgi:mannose-1-phosphate guanylyltransferase
MLHAVIMAGGSGTRFWPASRRHLPKQFLSLVTDTPLLRMTYERLEGLVPPERIWVVTTTATTEATRELLPELPGANVLAEPVGRNTASCAGFAAHVALSGDPEATCIVLPADHVIGEVDRFRAAIEAGTRMVERDGGLLTFGVKPTRPETGYGYLELGAEHARDGEWAIHRLQRFVEKPDLDRARLFVESGHFLWNAGIFAWRATDLLNEIGRQLPDLAAGLGRIAASHGSADAGATLEEVYPTLPATSVDFGVMEKAERCWTVPVDFPWSDIGSWPALEEVLPGDAFGNRGRGRTHIENASGNVLVSTGPTIAAVGVEDLVVVATPDAVLVVPRAEAQKVKAVVEALRDKGWDDVL